jgi:hypothetical protein
MAKPSKSKPTKPAARKPAKRTPRAPAAEPEVLAPPEADAAPARPRRREQQSLTELADHLAGKDELVPLALAIVEVYGGAWSPDRELSVLKILKDDDRFIIQQRERRSMVGLVADAAPAVDEPPELTSDHIGTVADAVGAAAAAAENTAAAASTDAGALERAMGYAGREPGLTLGEALEQTQNRPTRIGWKVDVGSHVLFLTEGHPPKKATIRNIHEHGSFALYDLNTSEGGVVNEVEAYRIGRDTDAEGELEALRLENAALRRHHDEGAALAQKLVGMQAEERRQAEALSKHRKAIEAVQEEIAEHARAEPGQQDLRDLPDVGDTEKAARAPAPDAADPTPEYPIAAGAAPATSVAERIAAGDVLELSELTCSLDDLHAARLERATFSTGKPQKVKPVDIGGGFILADVQDGVAVLLPVVPKEDWQDAWGVRMDLPSEGTLLVGTPVKVGRSLRWIGPNDEALLVRLPAEMPPAADAGADAPPSGKDAAAGAA